MHLLHLGGGGFLFFVVVKLGNTLKSVGGFARYFFFFGCISAALCKQSEGLLRDFFLQTVKS